MLIGKNCVVSIRYIMKNGKGEVLENTMNNDPVSYLHGSNCVLAMLQDQLTGLKAGDNKRVYLAAAPELTNEVFIFEVIIDEVRVALKEEVLLGYPVNLDVVK